MPENGLTVTYDGSAELLKAIKELTGRVVMVGIPENSPRTGGEVSNATLGYIHEFGSPARNIPPRPFLIPGANSIADKAEGMMAHAASLQMDGKPGDAQATLQALGQMAADAIRGKIVSGPFTPLKAATLAARVRRGNRGTKPLIDTTQMMKAITWVIRKRSGR